MASAPNNANTSSSEEWTVRHVLEWTTAHLASHGSETPRLDAEILLAHARNCDRIQLYTRFDEPLQPAERQTMRELVRRRASAEPVAYLVGHREFYGIDFLVTSDVLVPRPETETLVLELLDRIDPAAPARILDVGTGSGCIAVAIAVNRRAASVTATDVSPAAIELAQRNAVRQGVAERIEFLSGDLFETLGPRAPFDAIVSNPPYVADSEIDQLQPDVRLHEPHLALSAGPDGLAVLRRLIAGAPQRLVPGGWLLVEISPEQAAEVRTLFETQDVFVDIKVINDLAGSPRVVCGRTHPSPTDR